MHTVPSVGSVAIAIGVHGTPRVANSGKGAQSQPALEALAQLSRAVELDLATNNGAFQCDIAHEHARQGLQVGRNVETHLKSWVGGTKIDLLPVADQPPSTLRRRQIGKIELHAGPARERVDFDAAAHVPHQQGDVEFIAHISGTEPALAPFAQLADDRREFPPRLGEVILRPLRPVLALDHPNLLELLQSQAEQASRHQRNAAVKIAELRAAAQQFAQHKRRPALGEDFGALGDRAELTVAFHHPLHRAPTSAQNRRVWLAHKSKFWTRAVGSVLHQARCLTPMPLKRARSTCARTSGAILSHSAVDGVCATPIVISYRAASEFRRTVQISDWIAAAWSRMSVAHHAACRLDGGGGEAASRLEMLQARNCALAIPRRQSADPSIRLVGSTACKPIFARCWW